MHVKHFLTLEVPYSVVWNTWLSILLFSLQVTEFNLSVKTNCFKLPPQGIIYIVWVWEWIEIENQSEDDTSDLEEIAQVDEENPYLHTDG